MSVELRINERALGALYDLLDDTQQRLTDMRPAWRELRRRWRQRADREWIRQQEQWPPLNRRYARYAHGGNRRATLVRTGRGRAALRAPQTFDSDRLGLVMGVRMGKGRSDAFHLHFHQTGAGVPRRPVWRKLSPAERAEWLQIPVDHLTAPLRARS